MKVRVTMSSTNTAFQTYLRLRKRLLTSRLAAFLQWFNSGHAISVRHTVCYLTAVGNFVKRFAENYIHPVLKIFIPESLNDGASIQTDKKSISRVPRLKECGSVQ